MTTLREDLRQQLPPMLAIAVPIVLGEISWMTMGLVDTIMVGRLGPEAIGAVGMGAIVFNTIGIFGIGMLLGLDTLIAQAFGAGDVADCNHSVRQGFWLAAFLSVPLSLLMLAGIPLVHRIGVHPDVTRLVEPFVRVICWSTAPLLGYAALRRYLQAMNLVKPVMIAIVTANLINGAGNWALIYGEWGLPKMGVTGSAWSTVGARIYMFLFLLAVVLHKEWKNPTGLFARIEAPDWKRIGELVRLGLPAASQILLEIGIFGVVTLLAGKLTPVALAAHEIALNTCAMMFMVPMGVGSAGAVRVGQMIGARNPHGARVSGWLAIALGGGFMLVSGLLFFTVPRLILTIYTKDDAVLAVGTSLLGVAAVFQLFDGLQTVATGVLRGAGDTKTPMLVNLFGHWVIGLPCSYLFGFVLGRGVTGLWIGLSAGLIVVGTVLVGTWARTEQGFSEPA